MSCYRATYSQWCLRILDKNVKKMFKQGNRLLATYFTRKLQNLHAKITNIKKLVRVARWVRLPTLLWLLVYKERNPVIPVSLTRDSNHVPCYIIFSPERSRKVAVTLEFTIFSFVSFFVLCWYSCSCLHKNLYLTTQVLYNILHGSLRSS